MVERYVRDVEVACSNHVASTTNRFVKPFEACKAVLFFNGCNVLLYAINYNIEIKIQEENLYVLL